MTPASPITAGNPTTCVATAQAIKTSNVSIVASKMKYVSGGLTARGVVMLLNEFRSVQRPLLGGGCQLGKRGHNNG